MRAIVRLSPLLPLLLATACGNDSNGTDSDGDATVQPDGTVDATDTDTLDTGGFIDFETATETIETEVSNPSADFGEPCLGNTDCESGWCVESPDGYICTAECLETCPESYDCKSVQNAKGDVTFLCLPRVQKLCVSCLTDNQCNGGACLTIAGSHQCAAGCDEETDCPDGYTCIADATNEKPGKFCQPISGTCDCSPPFEGVTRLCTSSNELGTCRGAESCDPTIGWVGCSAAVPVAESCDYLDNDCDGSVDEEFKTDGVYSTAESCGSCGARCDDVLANAATTECVVQSGTPRCQVITCDPGYTAVNQYVCAPDASSLCQPCLTAAECLGTQAACTTLDDGDFCSLPCTENSDCATGFVCDDSENGLQCVPEFGSCTCDGSNTNLARSCTKIFTPTDPEQPVATCKGFEQCTTTGWGGCDLPDDECDGIDNDCDGSIDGPFKTGEKYTAIEHCGACGISCLAFVRPNAAPVCETTGAVPQCGYQCAGTAVDVNGLGDDGCECVPVPGDDLAGDDLDSNCDGVDGEVANAIFVSKDGDDTNPGTIDFPVLTLQSGLTKAKDGNKRDVYVATGVYSQNIVLEEGVGIFGGYAPNFDQHDVLLYETAIIGGTPDGSHLGTVTAINLGPSGAPKESVIDGFTIFGVNAGNIRGGNSYGIYIRNSGERLRVSKNRIFGGPGGNGENGTRGVDGTNGVDGIDGIAAKNLSTDCVEANESGGGNGGELVCGGFADVSGGDGGKAVCPKFETTPANTAKGANGMGSNSGLGGTFGWPFYLCAVDQGTDPVCRTPYTYACTTCYLPQQDKAFNASAGSNGTTGNNGVGGSAGASAGSTTTGEWVGSAGGNGTTGENGSGGGGGGAAGGVQVDGNECATVGNDDVSGSGGGGGSGGCLATGGNGGKAGGGSFGIFIVGANASHTPQLIANVVQSGRGGLGGAGGAGGVGGAAGQGGEGGTAGDQLPQSERAATRCAAGGGTGGNGGSGGHGGGGGGGAGGPSYGLYVSLPTTPPAIWKTNNTFQGGGLGGEGGLGGASVNQSSSGTNGSNGTAASASF